MTKEELEVKVKEVFSDKDYVESLFNMETPEEVQESLSGKGIDLTVDEIIKLKDMLANSEDGELSDEDLESVSGGSLLVLGIIAAVVFVVGIAAGAGTAFLNNHLKTGAKW